MLDGLGKNLSICFFVVAIVCVLVCPTSEVVVLAEQQLQGFGDHVRWRSIDELSIELKLSLYDSSTRAWMVTALGCFGGDFNIDN